MRVPFSSLQKASMRVLYGEERRTLGCLGFRGTGLKGIFGAGAPVKVLQNV